MTTSGIPRQTCGEHQVHLLLFATFAKMYLNKNAKTTFIRKLSSKANFVKDHSHQKHYQKPLSSLIPLKGDRTKHLGAKRRVFRVFRVFRVQDFLKLVFDEIGF